MSAVAVLDETGQEKKGDHTVGVKRQYVGCAGQVANAINVVYCTYATPRGHVPPWATGDEVYGRDKALRRYCQDNGVGYVLGVPCSFTVQLNCHLKARADKALGPVPAKGWTKASCGPGSKSDRL